MSGEASVHSNANERVDIARKLSKKRSALMLRESHPEPSRTVDQEIELGLHNILQQNDALSRILTERLANDICEDLKQWARLDGVNDGRRASRSPSSTKLLQRLQNGPKLFF